MALNDWIFGYQAEPGGEIEEDKDLYQRNPEEEAIRQWLWENGYIDILPDVPPPRRNAPAFPDVWGLTAQGAWALANGMPGVPSEYQSMLQDLLRQGKFTYNPFGSGSISYASDWQKNTGTGSYLSLLLGWGYITFDQDGRVHLTPQGRDWLLTKDLGYGDKSFLAIDADLLAPVFEEEGILQDGYITKEGLDALWGADSPIGTNAQEALKFFAGCANAEALIPLMPYSDLLQQSGMPLESFTSSIFPLVENGYLRWTGEGFELTDKADELLNSIVEGGDWPGWEYWGTVNAEDYGLGKRDLAYLAGLYWGSEQRPPGPPQPPGPQPPGPTPEPPPYNEPTPEWYRPYAAWPGEWDYEPWAPEFYERRRWVEDVDWSAETEFLDAVNQLIPFMSPIDQEYWMSYLAKAEPEIYGDYFQGLENWEPPRDIDQWQYDLASRPYMIRDILFGPGGEPGNELGLIDPNSPVGQQIASILQLQQKYGAGSENVGARRTRAQQEYYDREMQRLLNWMPTDQEAANVWNLWRPLLEELVSPTMWQAPLSERASLPTFRQGSYLSERRGQNIGWGWQNPRWL